MLSLNCVAIGISMASNPNAQLGFYWTTVFGGVADEAAKEGDTEPAGGNNGGMGGSSSTTPNRMTKTPMTTGTPTAKRLST